MTNLMLTKNTDKLHQEVAAHVAADSISQDIYWDEENNRDFTRAVLARWGHLMPQPVSVSERLPGPGDCTAQGWCWVFYRGFATWTLEPPLGQDGKHTGYTHWLPAHALPTPEDTNDHT